MNIVPRATLVFACALVLALTLGSPPLRAQFEMCPSNVAWDGTECITEDIDLFPNSCRANVCYCFKNGPPIQTFIWQIRQIPPEGCRTIGNGYGLVDGVHRAVARHEAAKHGTSCIPPEARIVRSASTTCHYKAGGDINAWYNCLNGGYCEGEFEVLCNSDDPKDWPVGFHTARVDKCRSDSVGHRCEPCHPTCPWLTSDVGTTFPLTKPQDCQ